MEHCPSCPFLSRRGNCLAHCHFPPPFAGCRSLPALADRVSHIASPGRKRETEGGRGGRREKPEKERGFDPRSCSMQQVLRAVSSKSSQRHPEPSRPSGAVTDHKRSHLAAHVTSRRTCRGILLDSTMAGLKHVVCACRPSWCRRSLDWMPFLAWRAWSEHWQRPRG